jgi:hydroxymethylglutaryl-CoA reductase
MRGAFTGTVTGKKVETREIVPRFTHAYPENLVEVERRSQWNGALNGINSRYAAIPHLRPIVAFAHQLPSFTRQRGLVRFRRRH